MEPQQIIVLKAEYPFAQWEKSGADFGMEQYTPEACAAFAEVFDQLIDKLSSLGPTAPESEKMEAFKQAVEALNALNEEDSSLIETGEREDLCELCNKIAVAAGLDPDKYGGGEGPASEWRDW